MGKSFTIRRNADGLVFHDTDLPDSINVPLGWFESGGIEGVLKDKTAIEAALESGDYSTLSQDIMKEVVSDIFLGSSIPDALRARLARYVVEPLFTREGMDMVFTFENHGPVRYSFIGFMSDPETGVMNSDAMMFNRVEDRSGN